MLWNGLTYTVSYSYNTIGKLNTLTYPLAPGQSTFVSFTPVAAGPHVVTVQATGIPGGCNTGTLSSWSGTLLATTSGPAS